MTDHEGWTQWNSTLRRYTPLQAKSRLSRGKRINPVSDRKKDETERAYGPEERRRMVGDMTCCVPGCHNLSENAHLPGAGGMGYKGDADTVVNLCGSHHRTHPRSLHNLGSVERFDREWDTNLVHQAVMVERKWQERKAA